MSDLNIQLLDTGENFIAISEDSETEFKYGQLLLCIANVDYNDMYSLISDFLQSNTALMLAMDLQKTNYAGTMKTELINHIIRSLYHPMYDLLGKEYLTHHQANIVTLLLMADIQSRFENNESIDLNKVETYLPTVYSRNEAYTHLRNTLVNKETSFTDQLQDTMNQIPLSSTIITGNGYSYQSYTITDFFDLLLLDMHKYLNGTKRVNECDCCHKLFFPTYRSTEKYCSFNDSHCKKLMKRKSNDSFAIRRDYFRGYQSGRIGNESTQKQYPSTFLINLYQEWSDECTKKYNEYKSTNDLDGFNNWFCKTKFTSSKLKSEYERFLQEKSETLNKSEN